MALIWLASFPRSGCALTRSILWQCFGVHVNALGPRPYDQAGADPMDIVLGPPEFPVGTDIAAIVRSADSTDAPVMVKTHDLPSRLFRDTDPAIVVVRDGRPVMTSFARFRTEVAGRKTDVKSIIEGRPRDWSEHVHAWLDHACPKLILRYEDLRIAKQESLDAISGFIGLQQIAPFTHSVEDIRAIRPSHIQVARNEPGIEAIERDHAPLFWARHRRAMDRLGYQQ